MLKSKKEGIVNLTRPRFGKRSSEATSSIQHGPDLENLNHAYIYRYLLQNFV